jgi:hypothetical protein
VFKGRATEVIPGARASAVALDLEETPMKSTLVLAVLSGCLGDIGDAAERALGPEAPLPADPAICDEPPAIEVAPEDRIRRLTHREYEATLRDLFAGVALPAPRLATPEERGLFANEVEYLSTSDQLVYDYERAAFDVARHVVATGHPLACEGAGCEVEPLGALLLRAFRRPPSPEELERFALFFREERSRSDAALAAELTIAAVLQTPDFLYRLELDPDVAGIEPVGAFALASRLSYFLWGSMPDDALFDRAASGTLLEPATIEAEVRRMLADPRAEEQVGAFVQDLVAVARLDDPARNERDPALYPEWDRALRESMKQEVALFGANVFREGGTLATLLTARTTFVDDELAPIYGVEATGEWRRVELPAEERAGFLTLPAFLAGHAGPQQPMPVFTGLYVSTEILGKASLSPPPDLEIAQSAPIGGETNRERWERDTERPQCAPCHRELNGIGFAFESYDALGRFRATDNGRPVDASGFLSGTDVDGDFEGAVELAEKLAGSDQVAFRFATHLLTHAYGRAPLGDEGVAAVCRLYAQRGASLADLLAAIATSPELRLRRRTR